jgi:hypothetical protein
MFSAAEGGLEAVNYKFLSTIDASNPVRNCC